MICWYLTNAEVISPASARGAMASAAISRWREWKGWDW
jgi:hypothetical protein